MAIDNIKSQYLLVNEVLEKPDDTDPAPKITSTLEAHLVKREFNVNGVCKFQFFIVASFSLPLHKEFCWKYSDPEVCDHLLLPLLFNPDNTCAACKHSYLGKKDWLECKICE